MSVRNEDCTLYPETLLEPGVAASPERHWMVLYTKARQEKALARDLFHHEVPFYLPLVRKHSLRRGRRAAAQTPLFSGYLFLFASEAERIYSLTTNRISRILVVSDVDRFVYELRHLQQLIASKAPLTIESRLMPGKRVRVRQGPFAGIEGTVLIRRGETRLLVSINFLQQGASVEIDDFQLEPID
jgi:transcriptional antiterminator RfaH